MRLKYCAVSGCFNRKETAGVTLFHFPRNKVLRDKWIAFCKNSNLYKLSDTTITVCCFVCSKHFPRSAFRNDLCKKLLLGAVPSEVKLPVETVPRNTLNFPHSTKSGMPIGSSSLKQSWKSFPLNDCQPIPDKNISYSSSHPESEKCVHVDLNEANSSTASINEMCDDPFELSATENTLSSCVNSPSNQSALASECSVLADTKQFVQPTKNSTPERTKEFHCNVTGCDVNSSCYPQIKFFQLTEIVHNEESRINDYRPETVISTSNRPLYVCARHLEHLQFIRKLKPCQLMNSESLSEFHSSNNQSKKGEYSSQIIPSVDNVSSDIGCSSTTSEIIDIDLNSNLKLENLSTSNNNLTTDVLNRDSLDITNYTSNVVNVKTEVVSSDNVKEKSDAENTGSKKYKFVLSVVKNIDNNVNIKSLKNVMMRKIKELFNDICDSESIIGDKIVTDNHNLKEMRQCDDRTDAIALNDIVIDSSSSLKHEIDNRTKETSKMIINNENISPNKTTNNLGNLLKNNNCYLCCECGESLKTFGRFERHKKVFHEEQKCHLCAEVLPSLFEFRKHIKHHKRKLRQPPLKGSKVKNTYNCEVCDVDCLNKCKLSKHKLIMHNIGEYFFCNLCNKKFTSKHLLTVHKKYVHNKKLITELCPYCGQLFASRSSYLTHLKTMHTKNKIYRCTICDKEFKTITSLKIHTARHTNVANKEVHDKASFLLKTSLLQKIHKCIVCTVQFTDIEALKTHMTFHENDEEVKSVTCTNTGKFSCKLCTTDNKCFNELKDLALHRYYCHNEIPFICNKENCSTTFWNSWELRLHQISKHVPRKVCNEECNKIQSHMKSNHSNEEDKPIICDHCGKCFCSKSFLDLHLADHTDNEKLKCNICEQLCSTLAALSRHQRTHYSSIDKTEDCFDKNEGNNIVENMLVEDTEIIVENIEQQMTVVVGEQSFTEIF